MSTTKNTPPPPVQRPRPPQKPITPRAEAAIGKLLRNVSPMRRLSRVAVARDLSAIITRWGKR